MDPRTPPSDPHGRSCACVCGARKGPSIFKIMCFQTVENRVNHRAVPRHPDSPVYRGTDAGRLVLAI